MAKWLKWQEIKPNLAGVSDGYYWRSAARASELLYYNLSALPSPWCRKRTKRVPTSDFSNIYAWTKVSRIGLDSMTVRSRIWLLAAIGLVFIQAMVSLILPPGAGLASVSDVIQCLLLVSGTLSFLPNVLANRGRSRAFWAFLMFGTSLWLGYQLLWTYFEVFLHQDVPNPFVGDVVLFLHFVPMMAALAVDPNSHRDDRTLKLGSLDFTMLLLWWLYLYLFAVIPWQYVKTDAEVYSANINTLYLAEKFVFLGCLLLIYVRSGGKWKTLYAHLFGASVTYSLSSYLANWALARNVYHSGSLYDLPLAASMAWITGVGLFGRKLVAKMPQSISARRPPVWMARLGMATVFSLPLFAAWAMFDANSPAPVKKFRLVLTLFGMLVMGAIIFLKQHLLDQELLGLLHASQESYDSLSRVQAQLVQSEKLASLGQLVGGAAHELNNPLTAMLGYSELLSSTELNGEQRAITEKIVQQVRRTQNLTSSLLSFAKQAPSEKRLLDLNVLVSTAVKLNQPQLRTANVQVRTELTPNPPQIIGDANQLLQVFLHLTTNAMQAMSPSGGTLVVSSYLNGDCIVLDFSDSGPGIEEPGRVFDPFYTTRPVGHGAGLGLSACYGIVQEHNGQITCQNRPEGGALFRIELPVAEAKEPITLPTGNRSLAASSVR
jgi:signal transduction histidine kinase